MLDINFLRENKKRLYYFGLGFIQLVLSDELRLHFYNIKLKDDQINDEIHNHRYNFKSKVLKGTLLEARYELTNGKTHYIINESCGQKNVEQMPNNKLSVGINLKEVLKHESEYNIFFNQFHSVSYEENTITQLNRSKIITNFAQVLYPIDKEIKCPFSNKMKESELWEIIEDTIKN